VLLTDVGGGLARDRVIALHWCAITIYCGLRGC
jgi:hypothetical protein